MKPASSNVALVLGGTTPHISLIEQLKDRGYQTVLVDYLESPPAKAYADVHIRESTLDPVAVLKIAREHEASLVLATCIDQANVTAIEVAEQLGLYTPYSVETAYEVSNKVLMKQRLHAAGIPTARHVRVDRSDDPAWRSLRFPLIVKPSDSNGSKGVQRCAVETDLSTYLPEALRLSRSGEAIIEEFIEGREIAFDAYVLDGRLHIVLSRERLQLSPDSSVQQISGSIWPAPVSGAIRMQLEQVGQAIVDTFRLDNTPLIVQTIWAGDQLYVIEFAPRIGGGENEEIIRRATGFDLQAAALGSFLGERPQLTIQRPAAYFFDSYLYSEPGILDVVTGLEEAQQAQEIEYFRIYKARGANLSGALAGNNRIGAFVAQAPTPEAGRQRIDEVLSRVSIRGANGEQLLKRIRA